MSSGKHHEISFVSKNVTFVPIKRDTSDVVYHDIFLETTKQHWTNSLQIAGPLESPTAVCSRVQFELTVQVGCHTFHFDFWLIIQSLGLPTSICYHLRHLSTTTSDASRNTSTRCNWIWLKLDDRRFIEFAPGWDTAAMQTPVSPPRHRNCSHGEYGSGQTFQNGT
jgi:hypothetical protein